MENLATISERFTMPTFAAIEITERNLIAVLSSLDAGLTQAQFVYACLVTEPTEERQFFVGGNYKGHSYIQQHWEDQILTESQMDETFTWDKNKLNRTQDMNWFPVTLRR
jgi:hypothetical protein